MEITVGVLEDTIKRLESIAKSNPFRDVKMACYISILIIENTIKMMEKEDNQMIGTEYQRLAMRTCGIPHEQKDDMLRHAVFGLASEAGEVAGILQKVYQGHEFDKEHMKKELGDCLWMIAEACEALNLSMDIVMSANIDKLRERYPEGFDPERSMNRPVEDI